LIDAGHRHAGFRSSTQPTALERPC